MHKRDILLDEIEELGRVLGKIIAGFFNTKTKNNINEAIEVTNLELKNKLDIDIYHILQLNDNELINYFDGKKTMPSHIEKISDLLRAISEEKAENAPDQAKRYLLTAISLLQVVDDMSNTLSFERINKKTGMENALQKL